MFLYPDCCIWMLGMSLLCWLRCSQAPMQSFCLLGQEASSLDKSDKEIKNSTFNKKYALMKRATNFAHFPEKACGCPNCLKWRIVYSLSTWKVCRTKNSFLWRRKPWHHRAEVVSPFVAKSNKYLRHWHGQ